VLSRAGSTYDGDRTAWRGKAGVHITPFYAAEAQPQTPSTQSRQTSEADSESTPDDESCPETSTPLLEGQLRVNDDGCAVEWAPDQKKLSRQSAEHQIISSRFGLRAAGREVQFMLMINPHRTQNRRGIVRAAFKNTQQRRVQLKCLEDLEALGEAAPVQVTFSVGHEQRCVTYDFKQTICEPVGSQAMWELPVPKRGEPPLVIRISFAAGPSRW